MIERAKKSGFTLTELIVTMSIIAVLAGIGLPAASQLQKSFESSSRVRDVVVAALSNARSTALARNKYVGIRFQQTPEGNQYMVFIVLDNVGTSIADGFRPVIGRNPIRLPRQGLVMDMHIRSDYTDATIPASDPLILDTQIKNPEQVTDATAFSVVFSPAGKLVMHDVRIWAGTAGDVFNDDTTVDAGDAMFYIDDYPAIGLGEESSRNNFVIIDKKEFDAAPSDSRWTDYLQYQKQFYINQYTGELID
jgi:prepilin-type N-terminal cleavage/methylation domain-containing protein